MGDISKFAVTRRLAASRSDFDQSISVVKRGQLNKSDRVVKRHLFGCIARYRWFLKTKMPEIPVAPPALVGSPRRFTRDTRAHSRPNRY